MVVIAQEDLTSVSSLSNADAAAALRSMTVAGTYVPVFGSYRTFAALLTQAEYDGVYNALASIVSQETSAGGHLYGHMESMLRVPGDEKGNGGGLDFGEAKFVSALTVICSVEALSAVPGKVASYVAGFQTTVNKYPDWLNEFHVAAAREAAQ